MIKNVFACFLILFALSGCASNQSNESQYFEDFEEGDVEYGRYG